MFSLLPEQYRKKLQLEYRIRLAIVSLLGFIALSIVTGVLIFPTYIRVSVENQILADQKLNLEKQIALQVGKDSSGDIKNIKQNINIASLDKRSVILAINTVTKVQSIDIKLINFLYTYNSKLSTLVIDGFATDRQSLQLFKKNLSAEPLFSGVELPLSDYAKDSNIPFSINLSGQF
ncbi:MAG: hypothetical protein WCF92_03040 [bacterium]